MWNSTTEPTKRDWYLVKIGDLKVPLQWNEHNKFFAEFSGKTYKMSDIDCWLDDSKIGGDAEPIIKVQRPEKHCVCCHAEIKVIDGMANDESWEGMFNDGIVEKINAGYGSRLDGNMYVLAICDDCVEKKTEEGLLEYVGDYMIKQ